MSKYSNNLNKSANKSKLKRPVTQSNYRESRIVGFLATIFLTLLALFYLPAVIFNGNSYFLQGEFIEYVFLSLKPFVVISLVASLVFWKSSGRIMRTAAAVISFIALSSFIMSVFITPFTVNVGLVDGSREVLNINYFLATLELGIALSFMGVLLFYYDRVESIIKDLFIIASILVIGYTGYVTAKGFHEEANNNNTSVFSVNEFMRFSRDENILVVLLDTLASDFLLALLEENTDLAQQLDGFTLFRDTASVSPTTYMAIPSIHGGRYVSPSEPFRKAYDEQVGKKSFLTAAASKGASVHLLNHIFNCPDQVNCGESSDVLSGTQDTVIQDWSLLIDIALFRMFPHAAKPFIYNDGDWYYSHAHKKENPIRVNSFRDNRVMHEFAQRLYVEGSQPQVKFIHLFNTHYPYNVGGQCELVADDNKSLELALNAARCGIEGFVAIIDALKKYDIYDSTFILLLADHGSVLDYIGSANADRINIDESLQFELRKLPQDRLQNFPNMPTRAHPIFAVKRPGERGKLKIDAEHAVSLTDTPATVCADTRLCAAESGINAFEAPQASTRKRYYNDYVWKPEFWGADNLENDVKKKVIDYSLLDGGAYDKVPGAAFLFNQKGFRFKGFGPAEKWGRWVNGREAELTLCFAAPPELPLQMVLESRLFLADYARKQRVVLRFNDEIVIDQQFEYSESEGTDHEMRALLQYRHIDDSGCTLMSFWLPDAVLPNEGVSDDTRMLALGLKSLRFE